MRRVLLKPIVSCAASVSPPGRSFVSHALFLIWPCVVDLARNIQNSPPRGSRVRGSVRSMGVCVGDLDQRQMERLRVELGEVLAAHVAYPPFFNYRTAQTIIRPLDRTKREEIDQYLRSVNFTPIERVDVTSPELRRFLERLFIRYIEVNPSLARPRLARRLPELRSRAPRMAAEVQRGLLALLTGQTTTFGTQRPGPGWSGAATQPHHLRQDREHNTRVLEAILVRRASGALPAVSPARPAASAAPAKPSPPAAPVASDRLWPVVSSDLTVPVPAQGMPASEIRSPFAGLEVGAQSDVFGSISSPSASSLFSSSGVISEQPTGPLVVPQPVAKVAPPTDSAVAPAAPAAPASPAGKARDLPPDLFQLYGDYLRDMEPEVNEEAPAASAPPAADLPAMRLAQSAPVPVPPPVTINGHAGLAMPATRAAEATDTRSDKLIFWQLRYQLEAYVRRAARSYGVQTSSGDPSGVIDALRRSRFVDEADLRIAEGILAITDRVTAGAAPTIEDYRQALMLYLLYHRSHLGT